MITLEILAKEEILIKEALQRNDSAQALLVSGGITDPEDIAEYKRKLDQIKAEFDEFRSTLPEDHSGARALYNFILKYGDKVWTQEPLLQKGIDNFLDPEKDKIGICWVVASLTYLIAEQSGLNAVLTSSKRAEHAAVIIMEDTPITVDPTHNFCDEGTYEDEKETPLLEFIMLGYLNRNDIVDTPEEKAMLCGMAIALAPHKAEGYSELTAVHIKNGGNYGLAIQLCRKALEIEEQPMYRGNLAMAYKLAGADDRALFEYTMLEMKYPDFEHLEELRKRIKKH